MTMTCEIPVWVNGVEKWVTGVGRRTTCGDLVRALLTTQRPPSAPAPDDVELRHHTIVERWRQVERPLDPAARIQKVWRTWGDDTSEVRFTLKRVSPLTPKELKQLRRKHHSRTRWRSSSSLETVHPRKLGSAAEDGGGKADMVERLMHTILIQGETIAAQLRRLHEREDLIGYYEHKMHRMREDELGSDYLLKTYLRDGDAGGTGSGGDASGSHLDKTSHDSGVGADLGDVTGDISADACDVTGGVLRDVSEEEAVTDLRQSLDYLERIVELNRRITAEEEEAVRLSNCIRRAGAADPPSGAQPDETSAEAEVTRVRDDLEKLASRCQRQAEEIVRNERAIAECERQICEQRRRLAQLERQLDAVDGETARLLAQRLQMAASITGWPPRPEAVAPVLGPRLEALGHPAGLPLGQPVGLPHGQPVGLPLGPSRLEPLGHPAGLPLGQPVGLPQGQSRLETLQPRLETLGQPVGLPLGPPPAEPRWTQSGPSLLGTSHTPSGVVVHKDTAGGDGDSNSDTGLSSLHSSSDEAAAGYVLDTLV